MALIDFNTTIGFKKVYDDLIKAEDLIKTCSLSAGPRGNTQTLVDYNDFWQYRQKLEEDKSIKKSEPTLASSTLSTQTLISGTQTFYKWTVAASWRGDINWKLITFYITGALSGGSNALSMGTDDTPTWVNYDGIYGIQSGATTSDTRVISNLKVYDSSSGTQVSGTFYYRSKISSSGYYVIFVPANEEIVAGGSSKTYELKGDFLTPVSGSSLNVGIPALGSFVFSNTYDNIAGDNDSNYISSGTNVIPTVSFIWSDKGVASHSVSTNDWRNDYKVSGLPTTTLTMTK